MSEKLHGECPQCGSCWQCWEDTVTRLRQVPVPDELVPVEQLFDLEQELVEAKAIIENLHTYLYDAGMVFLCRCGRDACRNMAVYLDTVKTNV